MVLMLPVSRKSEERKTMKTRCKMTLTSLNQFGNGRAKATFECLYDEALTKEDAAFSKFTPCGNAEFDIENEAVTQTLMPGKAYYFDISEVPEEAPE